MADSDGRVRPPRGFAFAVLRAVQFLGLEASGTAIRDHLERKTGQHVDPATVYVSLSRLERQGLVNCHAETGTAVKRRGRPRNIYSVEAPGLRALDAGVRLYGDPVTSQQGAPQNEGSTESSASKVG